MFEFQAGKLALAEPLWLLLLLLLPLIAWFRGRRAVSAIVLPFSGAWRRPAFTGGSRIAITLAFIGVAFAVIAMARPQYTESESHTKSKGYDIMLCLDLSTSMYSEDFTSGLKRVNRLAAVKPVVSAFMNKRENDRIGLVAFAARAYTVAPLTFDHDWLAKQTNRLKIGLIEEDGTAIGDALGVAISRLQEGAKERAGDREGAFVVLLTDGDNNSGSLEPDVASNLAKDTGIRVFTIGAGRNGPVSYPVFDEDGKRIGTDRAMSRFDERGLMRIAEMTDGEYFRADSSSTIEDAFEKIDEESKIEFEVNQFTYTTELFPYFGLIAGAFLFIAALSTGTAGREVLA